MDSFSEISKRFLPMAIVLSLVVVFHKPIEILLDATFVKFALAYVEHSWYCDLIVIGVAAFFVRDAWIKFKRKYVPNDNLSLLLFGLVGYYVYYRFFNNHWGFTPFSFCNCLYYADISFVVFLTTVIHYLRRTKKDNRKPSFYNDEPLRKDGNDELGYKNYAHDLAAKLENRWFETSFAVGIKGKWGIGKTSFVTLLRSELSTKKDIIEVEFNPWRSSTPDAIVNDFFLAFSSALSPYHSGVSRLISIYMQRMSDLSGSSLLQSLSFVSNLTHNSKAIGDLHQDINDALEAIDKKIVVYIDDIDRLHYDEVLEVLKLIRNTANFRNTIFVVAYDRDYLASAIKSRIDYNGAQYIEKIFQLEITLPYFNKKKLREKLAENLKGFVGEADLEWIRGYSRKRFAYKKWFPEEWLYSMRDVTRLSNSIILNYFKVKEEVVFEEFFKLELLHVKFPSVYELLYREIDRFLMKEPHSGLYQLRKTYSSSGKEVVSVAIVDYLKNNKQMLLSLYEIQSVVKLLESVYDADRSSTSRNNKHLSVTYPSKFERYFAYRLFDGALSNVEFGKARETTLDVFCSQLNSWVNKGMEEEVVTAFVAIRDYDSRDDFEKVISAIFYLGSCKSMRETSTLLQIVAYDAEDLTRKLTNTDILSQFYTNGFEDKEYWDFVADLFLKAKYPFVFEANYAHLLISKPANLFPVKRGALQLLVLQYLSDYCEKTDSFKVREYRVLLDCCYVLDDDDKEVLPPAVLDYLMTFANNDLDNFLCTLVYKNQPHDNYKLSSLAADLYGSWAEFEMFLDLKKEGQYMYLQRFVNFFNEFVSANYNAIPFDFGDMPIDR